MALPLARGSDGLLSTRRCVREYREARAAEAALMGVRPGPTTRRLLVSYWTLAVYAELAGTAPISGVRTRTGARQLHFFTQLVQRLRFRAAGAASKALRIAAQQPPARAITATKQRWPAAR